MSCSCISQTAVPPRMWLEHTDAFQWTPIMPWSTYWCISWCVYTHKPLASVWSAGLTHVSLKGSVLASSWWHHHQHSLCRLLSQTPSCLFTTVEFFQSWGNGGDWWGAELRYYNVSSQVHTGQEERSTIWWQSWLSLSDGAARTKIKQMVKHWNIGTSAAVVQSFFTLNNNK